MVAFSIIAGGLISLFLGWIASEVIFGKSSSAGYHTPSGRFTTKSRGTGLKLYKIILIGVAGIFLTAPIAGFLASLGPVATIVLAFALVFIFLHIDIDQWKFR